MNSATPSSDPGASRSYVAFSRFAWGVFGYILFVIVYGAWVRITGSGAGCGEHWPTCNGELVPLAPSTKTIIEYTHRVTSGVLGPLVIAQFCWALWGAGRRRIVKWCAGITLLFVIFEALLGAGLVLASLVADDASGARALVVSLHLGNTLILTASAAFTAWFGRGRATPVLTHRFAGRRALWAITVGIVLVSLAGAITALGDTLFPIRPPSSGGGLVAHLAEGLQSDVHFLVRLRVVHPLLALGVGFAALFVLQRWTDASGQLGRLARWVVALLWTQLTVGLVNIVLAAPGWMQLAHLLVGEALWAALVIFLATAHTPPQQQTG